MAITNYGELKTAVGNWLARTDLAARIPEFVALCEAEIKRDVRRKTIRTTLTVAAESTALPTDLAELRTIYPETGSPSLDKPLTIGTPEMVAESRARHSAIASRPRIGAIVDGNLIVPPVNQSYTFRITYYQKLVALVADGDTNAVLTEAPDIYLYGTLKHAAPYLAHDERLDTWGPLYDKAVAALNLVRVREETAASLKKARLPATF